MTTRNAKEVKNVLTFLIILSLLVLGSFILERNPMDGFYLVFVVGCMFRYIYFCKKND